MRLRFSSTGRKKRARNSLYNVRMPDLRLVQISDFHIAADPGARYRGQPALANTERLIRALACFQPDVLIATGDLSEDASAASYALIRRVLADVGAAVFCLPGNHDDPQTMRAALGDMAIERLGSHAQRGWHIHMLDSTIPDRPSGGLSADQITALDERISTQAEDHAIVFLHHQPILVGSRWIDRYGLEDGRALRELVTGTDKIKAVGWGHIHHAFRHTDRSGLWLGCPSAAANTLPRRERFTPDSAGPAGRWFRLQENGRVYSGILRA